MDNITFGTNWIAQAEQDGFYQTSLRVSTKKDYDLDVTLKMGVPQVPSGT
ncbi:hypothetical protein [Nostoc sp.]